MRLTAALALAMTLAIGPAEAEHSVPLQDRVSAMLTLGQTIPLHGVEGRIDHLAVDLEGRRLFVAALGNNTLEVIDLAEGKQAARVTGFREPQGVAFDAGTDRLIVANGGDGVVHILSRRSLARASFAPFGSDADNVRVDREGRVYVGYGSGAIGEVPSDGVPSAKIPLAAHPESFQLETNGPRIFVNVPNAGHIAVLDRERRT